MTIDQVWINAVTSTRDAALRERDLTERENARLRKALQDIALTEAAARPGVKWVHWAEQARRALHGKG
jgi:hypothetical protein